MQIPKDNSKLEKAKALRRDMTQHERKLWYLFSCGIILSKFINSASLPPSLRTSTVPPQNL